MITKVNLHSETVRLRSQTTCVTRARRPATNYSHTELFTNICKCLLFNDSEISHCAHTVPELHICQTNIGIMDNLATLADISRIKRRLYD